MAIFYFQANVIQRSKGRSAVAAAAYRAGIELIDERTGLSFDYSQKKRIGETFIIGWSGSRADLWNAAEAAEKRKDSTTAREYVVALPKELDPMDRQALARELAELINDRYGVVVDVCLHGVDSVNPHAHLLTTTREVCPVMHEIGKKSIIDIANADRKKKRLLGTARDELEWLKIDWCNMVNSALELRGLDGRIDHKSLKKQGILDREAQIKHYGNPKLKAENDAIQQRNADRVRLQQELYDLYHEQYLIELQQEQEYDRWIDEQIALYDEEKRYLDHAEPEQPATHPVDSVEPVIMQEDDPNAPSETERLMAEFEAQFAAEDAAAEVQDTGWTPHLNDDHAPKG